MRGRRFTRTALTTLLLLGTAIFVRDVHQLLAEDTQPPPALSAEEKLKIRDAQVAALESSQQLAAFWPGSRLNWMRCRSIAS